MKLDHKEKTIKHKEKIIKEKDRIIGQKNELIQKKEEIIRKRDKSTEATVLNLVKRNLTAKEISLLTGLSIKKINEIRNWTDVSKG